MKNIRVNVKRTAIALAVVASLASQTVVFSRTVVAGPAVAVGSSSITVDAPVGDTLIKVVIRVAMPDGTVEERLSNTGSVLFDASNLADGSYRYEAWALMSNSEGKYTTENSRGSFKVSDGSIQPDPAPAARPASDAEKASVLETIRESVQTVSIAVLDFMFSPVEAANLTADSSLPSIIFDDTSDASGNGSATENVHDWVIRATDDAGSATFRIIDDIEDANGWDLETVVEIQHPDRASGGDTSNSIVIDELGNVALGNSAMFLDRFSGKMGLGTTTPEQGIHAKYSGKTGFIRMEDTANSTWDFGQFANTVTPSSSDGDFSINIEANGNGGPTGAQLAIKDETGFVGIGTSVPVAKLDVRGDVKATFSGASTSGLQELFVMSANNSDGTRKSDAGFVMENAREGFSWAFRTDEDNEGFSASKQGTGSREFELINTTNVSSNVELRLANGAANVNGVWLNASSRSYKKNIHDLSGGDAMQALRGLKSVTYQYKQDTDNEQMVGFIAEDVPQLIATHDRKTLDPMKIVAVLTKAMQEQDKAILSKDRKISEMEAKLEELGGVKQRLSKIEAIMKKLTSQARTDLD